MSWATEPSTSSDRTRGASFASMSFVRRFGHRRAGRTAESEPMASRAERRRRPSRLPRIDPGRFPLRSGRSRLPGPSCPCPLRRRPGARHRTGQCPVDRAPEVGQRLIRPTSTLRAAKSSGLLTDRLWRSCELRATRITRPSLPALGRQGPGPGPGPDRPLLVLALAGPGPRARRHTLPAVVTRCRPSSHAAGRCHTPRCDTTSAADVVATTLRLCGSAGRLATRREAVVAEARGGCGEARGG